MREAAAYVAGLDVLPLARVVNDAKVDDHHAIVPTGELPRKELTGDDARVFDLVVRRFLAVFHPEAKFEDTEIITEAGGHRFRTRGRRLVEAGWRAAAFGEEAAAEEPAAGDDDELRQSLPKVDEGESGTCEKAEVLEKQTKPPPRYSEASLLKDMETAGKQIEDEELRDAMKEAGLGTPATRAETIEKLIRVGYIERLGKQLRATSKGRQAIALLGDHALTSAQLTGSWEKRLSDIERGAGARDAFMHDIRDFTSQIVEYFRELSSDDVRALRAEIGPCPNCDGIIRENRLAYGCSSWKSREEPGCGFVIWKQQKGRSISAAEARELLEKGQTELLDGFKTRPSRARLVLAEGNQVQLIADDGTRLDAPAGPREKIADCPKCDGEIRENSRAYGCSSWKSKKETGCGFVIWKSTKGRQISIDEARQVIEKGASDWMEFKDRKGPFRGRLVLTARPDGRGAARGRGHRGRDPGGLSDGAHPRDRPRAHVRQAQPGAVHRARRMPVRARLRRAGGSRPRGRTGAAGPPPARRLRRGRVRDGGVGRVQPRPERVDGDLCRRGPDPDRPAPRVRAGAPRHGRRARHSQSVRRDLPRSRPARRFPRSPTLATWTLFGVAGVTFASWRLRPSFLALVGGKSSRCAAAGQSRPWTRRGRCSGKNCTSSGSALGWFGRLLGALSSPTWCSAASRSRGPGVVVALGRETPVRGPSTRSRA